MTTTHKKFIATIGVHDKNTTECITIKEIAVEALDKYEGHKAAFLKCDVNADQEVFKLVDSTTGKQVFDFISGFLQA